MKLAIPYDKIDRLKKLPKLLILFGTIILFGVIFYFAFYQPLMEDIKTVREENEKLEKEIAKHRKEAQDIKKLEAQLKVAKAKFEDSRRFLPERKEVPKLLEQISEQGAEAQIRVVLVEPKKEVLKDFYAEIPFLMQLEGPYLNVTTFFDSVRRMDRIVNIADIDMGKPEFKDGEVMLLTKCQGMTFRFMTEQEIEAMKAKKAASKRRKP